MVVLGMVVLGMVVLGTVGVPRIRINFALKSTDGSAKTYISLYHDVAALSFASLVASSLIIFKIQRLTLVATS
jgi:hypothetical protein